MTDNQIPPDVVKLWDDHPGWGTPNDYAVVIDQQELDGFKVGQTVRVTDDCDSDDGVALADGEEGIIIGVYRMGPGVFHANGRDGLVVYFDGLDPVGVSPDNLEPQ